MDRNTVKAIIDEENGEGFWQNVDTNRCYTFSKNGSFMIFRLQKVEGIRIANVRYFHFETEKDMWTVLAYACNFWMGNNVRLILYREKERASSPIKYLKALGFATDIADDYRWKHRFRCAKHGNKPCNCKIFEVYR